MAKLPTISIAKNTLPKKGTLVFLVEKDGQLPKTAKALDTSGQLQRAVDLSDFSGASKSVVTLVAPDGVFDKWIVLGCGEVSEAGEADWMKLGGKVNSTTKKSELVTIIGELGEKGSKLEAVSFAAMAAGAKMAAYDFDQYKTKSKKPAPTKSRKLVFAHDDTAAVRREWKRLDSVSDGVLLARDLVNLPPNVLTPVEFAKQAKDLEKLGVKVEILGDKELKKLKMGALLGVAQGSEQPARMAIMKWDGGKAKEQPIAFVGKGVIFDTGGISLKPGGGMEDMKGDMGGAAAVTGLMHALASRKAKVNVIGIIGIVENMPDGNAYRPGDILTSMSGQTIEIINTDAEGRLVLADALWYCHTRFKPKFMINLATLTGAILVALGKNYAGLFSNNDELAENIYAAGLTTDEKVWRMPLDKEFDKMIDSKFADMKNTGGRYGGSSTAGQFLQRYVEDTPWAHLDIAGTAMGSPKHEFNQSWGSGYGVRLLDRLVSDFYE
ncbi:MAG: leucyl aminopeptidase [Hyphomicrobiales bacterium]|nr:MAG: leucyl aminopeptidase [Hyphomicrobiales bacterium]